jgi:hypothetical protein
LTSHNDVFKTLERAKECYPKPQKQKQQPHRNQDPINSAALSEKIGIKGKIRDGNIFQTRERPKHRIKHHYKKHKEHANQNRNRDELFDKMLFVDNVAFENQKKQCALEINHIHIKSPPNGCKAVIKDWQDLPEIGTHKRRKDRQGYTEYYKDKKYLAASKNGTRRHETKKQAK